MLKQLEKQPATLWHVQRFSILHNFIVCVERAEELDFQGQEKHHVLLIFKNCNDRIRQKNTWHGSKMEMVLIDLHPIDMIYEMKTWNSVYSIYLKCNGFGSFWTNWEKHWTFISIWLNMKIFYLVPCISYTEEIAGAK